MRSAARRWPRVEAWWLTFSLSPPQKTYHSPRNGSCMGVRLRGTAVESAAGSEAAGVTDSSEILSDASSVILKSNAPRSAVTRTCDLWRIGLLYLARGGYDYAEKRSGLVGRHGLLHLSVVDCLDGRRIV